jgi:hypothetical protein
LENEQNNKVTLKISGKNRTTVLKALKKIESVFPLFIEGKEKPNDDGDGIHIFLVVACTEET